MSFGFIDPWHLLLPREGGHVIGCMGSGGKTSLLLAVAAVYQAENRPVVLTTTTRCEVLPGLTALAWSDLAAQGGADLPGCVFLHDGLAAPGKWRGLTPAQVDELGGLLPDRVVLVEVDGAAKHPLKVHRTGEPVWPSRTSLALVVIGVGAVGGRLEGAVHRWGEIPSPALAGLPGHTVLTWDHVAAMLLGPGGYLEQVPAGVPAVLALGGLAGQDDSIGLFEFVGRAMEHPALPLALFCSGTPAGLEVRAACVDREPER